MLRLILVNVCEHHLGATVDLRAFAERVPGGGHKGFSCDTCREHCFAREATPADIDAALVAQCRADGRAERLRSLAYAPLNDQALIEEVLKRAGLLPLLDAPPEAGKEEGRP